MSPHLRLRASTAAVLWIISVAIAQELEIENCCSNVVNDELCFTACAEVFNQTESETLLLNSGQIQSISSACTPTYVQFWTCFNQSAFDIETPTLPVTEPAATSLYSYCCDIAETDECKNRCLQYINSDSPDELIPGVIEECGDVPPYGIWNCLINTPTTPAPPSTAPPEDVDWARIQCCYKAQAGICRDSCLQLYSSQVISTETWYTLQLDCIHRPSERALSTCLSDVGTPCQLGCSDLQFCTNFNNRPTESFRQCSTSSDRMAKNDYNDWIKKGQITHPLIRIAVDINNCHPEMWKAVACINNIQPCQPTTHATQICRRDCIQLLTDCANGTILPQAVCDIIAPASTDDYCIPLSKYLAPTTYTTTEISMVTNPCDPSPCAVGFYCSVNHMCRSGDLACSPYTCQPGCIVGERPSFILPEGSKARVQLFTDVTTLAGGRGCYGYFNCTLDPGSLSVGAVMLQLALQHCEEEDGCVSVGGDRYAHQSSLQVGCSFCSCFHGRITCTNSTCDTTSYAGCDCPPEYAPVCTSDGRTVPSPCVASCIGYGPLDYRNGDCGSTDPCAGNTCVPGSKCVPYRRVCFSNNVNTDCKQFACEPINQECVGISSDPVCDSSNHQHPDLCALIRTQEEFGYFGYCKSECSRMRSQLVCGVNGETFESTCHAAGMHIAVDYTGPCTAIPGSGTGGTRCAGVTCPPLPLPGYAGVLPPDACCPKWGAHMTILADRSTLDRNIEAMGRTHLDSTDIITRLRHYITTLQCDLFGHISLDNTLSVLVLPVINTTSPLVFEACNQEATRLSTFINNHNPTLASDPVLSHLTAASVQTLIRETETTPTSTTTGTETDSPGTSTSDTDTILVDPTGSGTRVRPCGLVELLVLTVLLVCQLLLSSSR